VEAVRIGTVVASNQRSLSKWRLAQRQQEAREQRGSVGLTGADLERVVMALALRAPDYVVIKG
jgi:hypothetical protein